MLSRTFFQAIKEKKEPIHQIAWAAGLKPGQVYRLTAGIDRPRLEHGDKRVAALCRYLKLPIHEAFVESEGDDHE